MHPINSSQALRSSQSTRGTQSSAVQHIPSTTFRPHFVVGGGDCLFRALHMGHTNQTDVPASNEQVMGLRQAAADYVTEHQATLVAHSSFNGVAGVNDLYGLLITQGQ